MRHWARQARLWRCSHCPCVLVHTHVTPMSAGTTQRLARVTPVHVLSATAWPHQAGGAPAAPKAQPAPQGWGWTLRSVPVPCSCPMPPDPALPHGRCHRGLWHRRRPPAPGCVLQMNRPIQVKPADSEGRGGRCTPRAT